MSKQTDFNTEQMTAEQIAAANQRLVDAGILTENLGTKEDASVITDDVPTGFLTEHAVAPASPAPPAPARKKRAVYVKRFKLEDPRLRFVPIEQLDACKDDAARRLLLGVSR